MLEKSLKNDRFGVCLDKESKTKDMPLCLCHHHAANPQPYVHYAEHQATKLMPATQQVAVGD